MDLPSEVVFLGGLGSPRVLSGYLLDGGTEVAIVETGPSKLVGEYLARLGQNVERLRWALVSHVHLDHAGGAWRLVELKPKTLVGVYERGYKHLADPSRLAASAREALGEVYEIWGEIRPTPQTNLVSVKDGEAVHVGRLTLRLIAAPGHAPHSSVWYLEDRRVLFSGDALGIYVETANGRFVWPTTPPPSYEYALALETISKIKKLKIDAVCFPHYGYSTRIDELFSLIDDGFKVWGEVTERAYTEGWGLDKTVEELSKHLPLRPLLEDGYLKMLIYMDVRGMLDYHARKHGVVSKG